MVSSRVNAIFPDAPFTMAASVPTAPPKLYTSEMFPRLEPYTELHRAFWLSMVPPSVQKFVPPVRDGLLVLLRDFIIVWQTDDGIWHKLIIPAGFVTDVASIPLLVQLIFHMHGDGSVRAAAIPHDLLYQLKALLGEVPALWSLSVGGAWIHDSRPWTKSMCDKFFAKIMKAYGTPLNSLIYAGVRFGGGIAYASDDSSRFYTAALYYVPSELRNSWNK